MFFFFKQKTAYEMRISDWSSDVCSSDLASPSDQPAADAVGYVFARTDGNVAAWVEKGLVAAGAVSDIDWQRLRADRGPGHASLREVARSEPFPRGVEMIRNDLEPRVRDRLRVVLRSEEPTSELQSLMRISY